MVFYAFGAFLTENVEEGKNHALNFPMVSQDAHVVSQPLLFHNYKWPTTAQSILWPLWLLFHKMPTLSRAKEALYPVLSFWFVFAVYSRSVTSLKWKRDLSWKRKPFILTGTGFAMCGISSSMYHPAFITLSMMVEVMPTCPEWVRDYNEISRGMARAYSSFQTLLKIF